MCRACTLDRPATVKFGYSPLSFLALSTFSRRHLACEQIALYVDLSRTQGRACPHPPYTLYHTSLHPPHRGAVLLSASSPPMLGEPSPQSLPCSHGRLRVSFQSSAPWPTPPLPSSSNRVSHILCRHTHVLFYNFPSLSVTPVKLLTRGWGAGVRLAGFCSHSSFYHLPLSPRIILAEVFARSRLSFSKHLHLYHTFPPADTCHPCCYIRPTALQSISPDSLHTGPQ